MKKGCKPVLLALLLVSTMSVWAQKPIITPTDKRQLQLKEDSLKRLAKQLIVDSLTAGRMRNDSLFIRTLVRSLQVKNSFYYPFDSVQGISKVYAPDSAFRIFTWSLSFDDYYSRQRGAIQLPTADGSLKLIPLRDNSEFTANPMDSVRNKDQWIGAVYYNIVVNKHNGKKIYTLFGFDDASVRTNKKWIETLAFDDRMQPQFGVVPFSFEGDSVKRAPQRRYSIEYKKEASSLVNFVPEEDMILVDHLISETDEYDKPYTLIPDGDYEGFKWQNGRWVHIDKVFNFKLQDGEAPVPDPLRDAQGNENLEKIRLQNEKNVKKKKG